MNIKYQLENILIVKLKKNVRQIIQGLIDN